MIKSGSMVAVTGYPVPKQINVQTMMHGPVSSHADVSEYNL